MTKTLIAATLIAALGGGFAATAARADAANGQAQQTIEYFHNGRNAPTTFDAAAGGPNDYLPMPTPGLDDNGYVSKSHGHP